jgi:ABC-2 type transport system permease protein
MIVIYELVKLSIRRQTTYRAATLAGLLTNVFFGLIRASVLVALYGAREVVDGMTVQDAITFTGLTQASIAYLALFNWYEVVNSVKNGQIGVELLKPVNYFSYWMSHDLGRAIVNLISRGLTIMVFYALIFDISIPTSLLQWLTLAVAIILAWAVSFSWRFMINLAAFWVPDAVGFCSLFFAFSWFLSGFLIPLRFLPDWFVRICYLTPFPHMINTPVEIYLGLIHGQQNIYSLLGQVYWILMLILSGQLILRLGLRRLVIQGG